MSDRKDDPQNAPVPGDRLSRLARLGGLAVGVAGSMLVDGARQWVRGERPSVGDLLMTPANALRVTHQLSHLRGAAMKVGQLISMDAGDMLPPELVLILGRLRADARPMPVAQVRAVLDKNWGRDWQKRLHSFSATPIAAASIGQVHRARTKDGQDLAIKIQYPGVRNSIDSDIGNVAALLRLTGILPKTLDIAPLLEEARRQLKAEADYPREGAYLQQFATLLADDPDFCVPALHADLTGFDVLAMSFVEGVPVETLDHAPQAERDRIAGLMIDLTLRELFEFKLMQTDPNFANYRYDTRSRRLVLLDFGATRAFAPEIAERYRSLLRAGLAQDRPAIRSLTVTLGFLDDRAPHTHQDAVMAMFEMAMAPLRNPGPFDFATSDLAARLRDKGMALAADRTVWHAPPPDLMFLQRKIGGVYLLASRLKARVDVNARVASYA